MQRVCARAGGAATTNPRRCLNCTQAVDAYQKEARLAFESLATVQLVGEKIKKKQNVGEMRAIFLSPLAAAEFEPKEIAKSSPAMLLLMGQDIKLIHVRGAMRGKEIGRGMAKYLTETAPIGSKLFVQAPACMSGSAERIWTGVGFESTTSVTPTAYYTRKSSNTKARPPAGVDTIYLSFEKK